MIVNGRYQSDISIADRALQYGDGCFTTIAFRNGCLEFYADHIQRLQQACQKLYLDFTEWDELTHYLAKSVSELNQDCVVKVLISRGEGGRGYSPAGCKTPVYIITHHAMPNQYENWQHHGIELYISSITLARQPLLAGIKHLNRLEQVLIKNEISRTKFDDALVCDIDGKIIETSVGNLFWKKDNQWYTPNLSHSGVAGVIRNQLLKLFGKNGIEVHVVQQDLNELNCVEEMFICNSLMKIVPVTRISANINIGSDMVSNQPQLNVDIDVRTQQQTKLFQSWLNQTIHQPVVSLL